MLAETTDRLGRAKLLPAQVEIMLAVGDVQGHATPLAADRDRRALRHPGAARWRTTPGGDAAH